MAKKSHIFDFLLSLFFSFSNLLFEMIFKVDTKNPIPTIYIYIYNKKKEIIKIKTIFILNMNMQVYQRLKFIEYYCSIFFFSNIELIFYVKKIIVIWLTILDG